MHRRPGRCNRSDGPGSNFLQLCTYCELLTAAQGVEPEHFHVVTPLNEETYRTADFGAYYRFVRSGFQTAATTEPAPDTYPDPVGYCDICRYWKHCDDRRRADDHPSLIAGIHAAHVREFQGQAMPTLAAIARCDGALPKEPSRRRRESYAGFVRRLPSWAVCDESVTIVAEKVFCYMIPRGR